MNSFQKETAAATVTNYLQLQGVKISDLSTPVTHSSQVQNFSLSSKLHITGGI
jgi:hypothetical protein